MSVSRPTLPELIDRIEQDFLSRLVLVGALLRRAIARIMSRVQAGIAHGLYGYFEYISKQAFATLADRDGLIRIGSEYGLAPTAAAFATGTVTATGTNGILIPAGTVLVRSDTVTYTVNSGVTIAGGTATLAVTATVADENSNCDVGTVLTFETPIGSVNATVTVVSISGGSDVEETEDFRSRVVARIQSPPNGGSSADYIAWAKSISGVTRAWCIPAQFGFGTVGVYFVRDNDAGTIIPDAGEVATVQTYIDSVRPVTAAVTVQAPTAVPQPFTLHIVPDTVDTRAAVTAELTDLLQRVADPSGTVKVQLSDIQTAVRNAAGVTDRTVTIPAADVTPTLGQIATMGTITWV
jgi:uncharacterized phage protein gp47/JayE